MLSAAEERELSERVQAGQQATATLRDAGIPPAERRRLRRIVADGGRARGAFVEANLRLVASIARCYRRRGVDLVDLVQEGNVGLVQP